MADKAFQKLLDTLETLENKNIWYRLEHIRDSIMIVTTVPGERWEIEFFADGHIEFERYVSEGGIQKNDALFDLLYSYFE